MKKTLIIIIALTTVVVCYSKGESYFEIAKQNITKYKPHRTDYVIVVDYGKNISAERLYVIDMKLGKSVISSRVSHAWNSGMMYATDFSNAAGSNKSACGVYKTCGTKFGKFGYSMIIEGLDRGVNNNASARSIIFHSSKKMKTPWSLGCFATPEETNKQIINLTKGGCLVVVIK